MKKTITCQGSGVWAGIINWDAQTRKDDCTWYNVLVSC